MKNLYVIGNGFDRFHGLPTSYGDFFIFVSQNNSELLKRLESNFNLRYDEKGRWSDFETDLGTFDYEMYYEDNYHLDLNDDGFRPSFAFCLEDDISESTNKLVEDIQNTFHEWLNEIDIQGAERKQFDFQSDDLFLSFNYTTVLEDIYEIDATQLLQIHGSLNKSELILGHNVLLESELEIDENGDSNRTILTDSINASKLPLAAFYKPVDEIISSNSSFFCDLSDIDKIIVLGHSLNIIDLPYFKEIYRNAMSASWFVSYREDEEKQKHIKVLEEIGISPRKIFLDKMENIMHYP